MIFASKFGTDFVLQRVPRGEHFAVEFVEKYSLFHNDSETQVGPRMLKFRHKNYINFPTLYRKKSVIDTG